MRSVDGAPAAVGRGHGGTWPLRLSTSDVWTVLVVAAPAMLVLLTRMGTPDLAYHLRAGTEWLGTGIVARTDTFTFGAAGLPWLNQQWGAQILLARAFRAGGWHGLAILRVSLVIATFAAVLAACRARGASPRASAFLTVAAFALAAQNLSLRPQLLAYPLFATCLWLVVDRDRHPGRLWALPVLTLVWVNVHGSFVLAPVLAGGAWLGDLVQHRPTARRTLAVAAATLAATLVSPFGPQVWAYAWRIGASAQIRDAIAEWQPTSLATPSGILFFASAIAVAVYLARRAEPTPWVDLVWLTGAFLLALPAIRGIVWWGLTAPVVVAGLLPRGRAPRARGPAAINLASIVALVACTVLLAARDPGVDPATGAPAEVKHVSQQQVDAVRSTLAPGARLFVAQPSASWFELTLPSATVFVDSRIELFPEQVWADYAAVVAGTDGWAAILDRWDVDAVVTDRYTRGLRERLETQPGWTLVEADPAGAVFVRTG